MQQLDAVRAIAISGVLVEHWSGEAISRHIPLGAGALGVSLFFVLSGFLITGTLLRDLDKRGLTSGKLLVGFYIRRFFRLIPAYYALIAILVLLHVRDMPVRWPWDVSYLSNIYVALGGRSNVFWTLSVEEQFYIFWPPLLLLAASILAAARSQAVFYAACALVILDLVSRAIAVGSGYLPEFRLTNFQLIPLGAGCAMAAYLWSPGRGFDFAKARPLSVRIFTIVAFACLAMALILWFTTGGSAGGAPRFLLNDILTTPFYAWLIFQAARGIDGPFGALLNNSQLRYVGRISYGIYLTHSFVPTIIAILVGPLPHALAAVLSVLVTFGVCALSWRYYEQPFIRLGRRLADSVQHTAPALTRADGLRPVTEGKLGDSGGR